MPGITRPLRIVPLVAVALVGAACSAGTGPEPDDETYALADVGGTSTPVTVWGETWIADTIRFHGGDWSRIQVVVLEGEDADPDTARRESHGFARVDGSRIVLDFRCHPNALALCVAPDTVTVVGSQLLRSANRYGDDSRESPIFRYTRVR